MDITRRSLFKQELLFRWVLIIGTIILIQAGEEYIGGTINHTYAYGIIRFLCRFQSLLYNLA